MLCAPGTTIYETLREVPVSTRWHRAHGRQTRRQRAEQQQLLTPQQEKALVDHLLRLQRNGYPARVKHLRHFAGVLLSQRDAGAGSSTKGRLPNKDWPQAFYKRHPELKAARVRAIDWQRHEKNIRAKVENWFEVMSKQLSERGVLQENVYNMDETGVLLSDLTTTKVLVCRNDARSRRGVGLRRTMITAVECISADGRCLPPLIIWPGKTIQNTWISHDTPDWHYACSDKGYMNWKINSHWVKNVFDPATRDRAAGKPRLLVIDGFNTHESLEVMTFCFQNNIVLCRQPSHTTHITQPCDVGVFSPLKTAYREQVDFLYRGGAETVNKAHFTLLYSRARDVALTSRNIRSGWSKTGLFPFNPRKVLDAMQEVPVNLHSEELQPAVSPQPVLSPTSLRTPTNTISFAALQSKLVEKFDHTASADPYLQKMLNAAQRAFAERELLREENETLVKQNNERNTRKHVKERKIGDAKIMTFEDIVEARRTWERAEAEKERKEAEKERKRAEKELKAIEQEKRKAEKEIKKAEKEKAKAARAKEMVEKKRVQVKTKKKTAPSGPCVGQSKSPKHNSQIAALGNDAPGLQFTPECPMQPCPGNAPVARMW